jgi:hypothetical protein
LERDSGHRALTQGPLIEAWLMKNDFQPVVGLRFNFRGDPNSHWNGVTDCGVPVVEPIGCSRSSLQRCCAPAWRSSSAKSADRLQRIDLHPTGGSVGIVRKRKPFQGSLHAASG